MLANFIEQVITHLDGIEKMPDLVYPHKKEQIELLGSVLLASETDAELGADIKGHADDLTGTVTSKGFGGPAAKKRVDGAGQAKRVQGNLASLSGFVRSPGLFPLSIRLNDFSQCYRNVIRGNESLRKSTIAKRTRGSKQTRFLQEKRRHAKGEEKATAATTTIRDRGPVFLVSFLSFQYQALNNAFADHCPASEV